MTPDFTQSASGLEPPTVLDHVLMPVADLGDGARRLYDRFGLQGIPGGRHPKVGTANFIVPLGRQYLELIAIVDAGEAAGSRLGARVARAVREGKTFVAWALRTTNLDAVRAKLIDAGWDLPPMVEGSRTRPDGQVLRWRTQDTEKDPDPVAIPFVIEWNIPEGLHPGQAAATHRNGVAAIKRVVVGARDPETVSRRLALLLGTTHIYEVCRSENEGVEELVIEHARGETVIR